MAELGIDPKCLGPWSHVLSATNLAFLKWVVFQIVIFRFIEHKVLTSGIKLWKASKKCCAI